MSGEMVYISWGGTGRSSALREAVRTAQEAKQNLVYLAVLDDDSFADLDPSMLDLVADELEWMLEAQIEMAVNQVGAPLVDVRLIVRYGGVVEEASDVVKPLDQPHILVGAPSPVAGHDSVTDLVSALERATGCVASLVEPA